MTTVAILLLLSEAAVSQLTHTQYTRKVGVKKYIKLSENEKGKNIIKIY